MASGRCILIHAQSLSGAGHFVRTYEIARALAAGNRVVLVDGGQPIPRPRSAHPVALLELPRLRRVAGRLAPLDSGNDLDAVIGRRRQILREAVERLRPDVVLVEHYPFSKWELRDEIHSLIATARVVNRHVQVVSSQRDLALSASYLAGEGPGPRVILNTLHRHFDAVLVHSDPRFIRLEEALPWAEEIRLPVHYTGFVSEKLEGRPAPPLPSGDGLVVVSSGGIDSPALIECSIEAWQLLRARGETGGRSLVAFLPLVGARWPRAAGDGCVRREPFSREFLRWLAAADLSVSHAGYNTSVNLLETRTRAILVPHPNAPDQLWRARRLAERGLARTILPDDLRADRLAAEIAAALAGPRPVHDLDLDGAATTRRIVETVDMYGPKPGSPARADLVY